MKKLLLIFLAVASVCAASADEKTVKYSMPFETRTSNADYMTWSGKTYFNSLMVANNVSNATTTFYAYTDGSYKIAAWCGVDGYDFDFTIDESGNIVPSDANQYWKTKATSSGTYYLMKTGLSTYSGIQVFTANDTKSRMDYYITEDSVALHLAYNCYVCKAGSETGTMTDYCAYYGRGYSKTPVEVYIREANSEDATTYDINTSKATKARLYDYGDGKYVVADWLGENTGDLSFTVDANNSITANNCRNHVLNSSCYYTFNSDEDCVKFDTGETYTPEEEEGGEAAKGYYIQFYYYTSSSDTGTTKGYYIQTCPFPEDTPTAINTVSTEANSEAISYNAAGQRVNSNTKGLVIRGGKKYINK